VFYYTGHKEFNHAIRFFSLSNRLIIIAFIVIRSLACFPSLFPSVLKIASGKLLPTLAADI
jgi:hypothetical protein